jgi:MFS family permease
MQSKASPFLLVIIVFAQFAGTSLWFAGNAILHDIQLEAGFTGSLAGITSIVQFGFIAGTLVFSLLTIADRFPAPRVFLFSSILAAAANCIILWQGKDLQWLYVLRFITGFLLAGIYPVGMKIAADLFPAKLGNALGFLVGALVLGTAFPHLLKSSVASLPWRSVVIATSLLATAGGLCILLIGGYSATHKVKKPDLAVAFKVFKSPNFRSVAFGYFGHMWELYALWAYIPVIVTLYNEKHNTNLGEATWSFIIIGCGALGCIAGGLLSRLVGSKVVAFYALCISGACCLLSFFMINTNASVFIPFMLIWGIAVAADSPQLSTLVAQNAPIQNKGSALTISTCIGFAITIVSIQVLKILFDQWHEGALLVLAIGPILGLASLKKYLPVLKQADK